MSKFGKAWSYLSGWKSVLVALGLGADVFLKGMGHAGILPYLTLLFGAVGWQPSDAAVDPGALAAGVAAFLAFGHAVAKAAKDSKAGIPAQHLRSIPAEAVDLSKLPA